MTYHDLVKLPEEKLKESNITLSFTSQGGGGGLNEIETPPNEKGMATVEITPPEGTEKIVIRVNTNQYIVQPHSRKIKTDFPNEISRNLAISVQDILLVGGKNILFKSIFSTFKVCSQSTTCKHLMFQTLSVSTAATPKLISSRIKHLHVFAMPQSASTSI